MRNAIFTVITAATFMAAAPAFGDDAHHPDQSKSAPNAFAPTSAKGSESMMNNMKKMREQMQTLHATTDPKEREKLLQEHMQTMQSTMAMMQGMDCPMMRGGMMGGEKRDAKGDEYPTDGSKSSSGTMHMMMEQMMEHQKAMQGPTK